MKRDAEGRSGFLGATCQDSVVALPAETPVFLQARGKAEIATPSHDVEALVMQQDLAATNAKAFLH